MKAFQNNFFFTFSRKFLDDVLNFLLNVPSKRMVIAKMTKTAPIRKVVPNSSMIFSSLKFMLTFLSKISSDLLVIQSYGINLPSAIALSFVRKRCAWAASLTLMK